MDWFLDWDREQYTFYKGTRSEEETVTCGVPEGSVLGPLLFLIYINEMPNCVRPATAIKLRSATAIFADDNTIFKRSQIKRRVFLG